MVFTAAQTNAFFTAHDQMGLQPVTVNALQGEGIIAVTDLADFDDDQWDTIAHNFRRPPANQNVVPLGAASLKRLKVASKCLRYYETVAREATAGNMRWNVLRNFELQHRALLEKKAEADPEVPKVSTRSLPVMQWSEAMVDVLDQCIGAQDAPLSYLVRAEEDVPNPCPPIMANRPHAAEYATIERELIARASHTHALATVDNDKLYSKIREAVTSTPYEATIKPFQRAKNGRGAYLALLEQHAGTHTWTDQIRKAEKIIHNSKWHGTGNFTLDRYCQRHRQAFVQMEQASLHVTHQLPDGGARVRYLLDGIETSDARLQASMASVRNDQAPDGPQFDFEQAVSIIVPSDPVARKLQTSGNKRPNAQVSSAEGEGGGDGGTAQVSSVNIKSGKGKTGVEFRFYTTAEYKKLTKEQRMELKTWRGTEEGKKAVASSRKQKKAGGGDVKAQVASVLKEVLTATAEEEKKEKAEGEKLQASVESCLTRMIPGISNVHWKNPIATSREVAVAGTASTGQSPGVTKLLGLLTKASKNASK
jgi:hypothetical protein